MRTLHTYFFSQKSLSLLCLLSLLGEGDPHLGLVILDVLAAHVHNDPLDRAGESEGWFVLRSHRRARVGSDQHRAALRQSIRRRYRKLATTDLLAINEKLDDARRALALLEVGLAGGLELHAQEVMAGGNRVLRFHIVVIDRDVVMNEAELAVLHVE